MTGCSPRLVDNARIEPLDPLEPQARRLLRLSDEYMAALYPAEANHMESIDDLQKPNVLFLGCYVDDSLAGCGAVKLVEGAEPYGEIKRLFVDPAYRGKGLSTALMSRLEKYLFDNGVNTVRLEVGITQPEARGLYKRLGYHDRPPFGPYVADPYSLFMEKRLNSGT